MAQYRIVDIKKFIAVPLKKIESLLERLKYASRNVRIEISFYTISLSLTSNHNRKFD